MQLYVINEARKLPTRLLRTMKIIKYHVHIPRALEEVTMTACFALVA